MPLPAIPFIIIGVGMGISALAAVFALPGCSKAQDIKEKVLPPSCDNVPKLDSYKDVDDASYRTFHALWLKEMGSRNPEPWLAGWLSSKDEGAVRARFYLGAADYEFRPICEENAIYANDKEHVAKWRAASAAFFKSYFSKGPNPADEGILVLLAGLAPVDAGSINVYGAMNAVNFPTEPPGRLRSQKTSFTQLIKAAYHFNFAADLADPASRFSIKRKPHGMKPKDAVTARQNLDEMKKIMDSVDVSALNERQRAIYDVLKNASHNLRASM
ncbi:MAG: hypothetical protein WC956_07255 [bacterium]